MDAIEIDNRIIIIRGIGKLFFEKGFPISISIDEANKKGMEVSILHVADECLKNGWSPKTVIKKLKEDFRDSIEYRNYDYSELEKFCFANYEDQREMIFKYLFGIDSKVAKDYPNIDDKLKGNLEFVVMLEH